MGGREIKKFEYLENGKSFSDERNRKEIKLN